MSKDFRAPSDDEEFITYWDLLLPKVVERENFHESHLKQLEVLCNLYLEYHRLTNFIKENGYTYSSESRYGISIREYPECKLRDKVIAEVRQYSRILGLILAKDTGKKPEDKDWD